MTTPSLVADAAAGAALRALNLCDTESVVALGA